MMGNLDIIKGYLDINTGNLEVNENLDLNEIVEIINENR